MNNFIDEFRNSEAAARLGAALSAYKGRKVTIMEVCGTHTMAIFRYGIRSLLPENIKLVSGPGCPVCVTPGSYIDKAVELARRRGVIIATFGDLMRVPGSSSSLLQEKSKGRNIRIVYSPLDALKIARENPYSGVVFLSIGFETTTPVIALAVSKASEEGLKNFSVLTANKTMPEVLKILASDSEVAVDGFLYPGHVSAITGTGLYDEICGKYGIGGVVAGFEPLDLLHAIVTLAWNINSGIAKVDNQYSRVVSREGNVLAREKVSEIFEPCDSVWRGIGLIPSSGLKLRECFSAFDAENKYQMEDMTWKEPAGCLCGEVLKGKKNPGECRLFGTACTPEKPVGACMVSSEGTCAAYYRYSK